MQPAREQSVFRAVAQFALTGSAVVLLLGLLGVQLLRTTGTNEAIEDAKRLSRLAGDAVVAPRLTPAVRRGNPAALAALDATLRQRLRRGSIVRVKVWDRDGRIVYSDEPRLIGSRYTIGGEELEALEEGTLDAEVSDLSEPENRFERRYGKLLEVYGGVRGPDGTPLLFETYQPFSSIAASGRRLWLRFLPALAGGVSPAPARADPPRLPPRAPPARPPARAHPPARAGDRRLGRRAPAHRRRAPRRTGQELAGVAFGLSAARERVNGGDPELPAAIDDAAARVRGTMRDLRTTLVDLHPPALRRSGLQAAVADLLSRLEAAGVETSCAIPADLRLPEASEALLFRTAREALTNVRKHAQARSVSVTAARAGDRITLTVTDDGRGFDPAVRAAEGHVGLVLLADLVQESGGTLAVESAPGRGSTVRVEMPG